VAKIYGDPVPIQETCMSDAMYLIQADGTLVAAPNTPYAAEDDLQELIAQSPELLAGALISPSDPRRWLLIRREAGIPDREGAGAYWALDHLLVDQDAVPTLVEVKRSSDPRLRREVVAQLLEYAANGTVYWEAAAVRAWFEADRVAAGIDPGAALAEFLGTNASEETSAGADTFWDTFDGNLRSGRIRLLFVADAIPAPLRRLIEFLNQQMPNVEVLGVELPQYVGAGAEGLRAVVPRVIGLTEQARARKMTATVAAERSEPWTVDEIIGQLIAHDPDAGVPAQRVVEWARKRGDITLEGNRGTTWRTVAFIPTGRRRRIPVFRMYGTLSHFLEIPVRDLMVTPPYADDAERRAFYDVLEPITRIAKKDPLRVAFAYLEAGKAEDPIVLDRILELLDTYLSRTAAAQ
jgi:hypothetical protein